MDAAELRRKNFIRQEQFPYRSALGWEYDSGDYHTALQKALEAVDYDAARRAEGEQVAAFKRGETRELMGIGVAFFTEIVGAGPTQELRHPRHRHVRFLRDPHPSDRARRSRGSAPIAGARATRRPTPRSSPPKSAFPPHHHHRGGRHRHRALRPRHLRLALDAGRRCGHRHGGRKIKAKAQMIAAYLLEVHDDDLEWDVDRFEVKGNPERFKTMKELAWAAYHNVPPGMEPGLEAVNYYDPPNMTYPFGAYICVVDIDVDTGETKVRRFYALDDCGTRINPMIIEGQVHGGLTEAFAIAMGQEIHYDETGNVTTGSLHGLLHADRGRNAALGDRLHHDALAASPDRRQGRGREPECRRRAGLLQRGQRRLRVLGRPTSTCRTTTGASGRSPNGLGLHA